MPNVPKTVARSRPWKSVNRMLITWGASAAAASPCAARAAISSAGPSAKPLHSPVRPKATIPSRKTRLRPHRSPARAKVISAAAKASRYDAEIHSSWVELASRSR